MASEDPWSVPIRSPLVGIGRLARTIFILGASLSFAGSWGAVGGLVASGATPLITSVSFFVHPGLLGHFWRVARGGKDLLGATLLWISHLGRGVCLGTTGGRDVNGLGVIDTFCLPKYRRSLNPRLVESFIPYFEAISPYLGAIVDVTNQTYACES